MKNTITLKKLKCIFIAILFCLSYIFFSKSDILAAEITPESNQYLEFKVIDVKRVEGKDKQVTAELWAYNIEFTSIDLNIYYDSNKLKPSDATTNDYITAEQATDQNMFITSDDLKDNLSVWFMQYTTSWLQYLFSVIKTDSPSSCVYTGTNSNGEQYTSIRAGQEGVKLGTFTYRLFNGKVDQTTFSLQPTEYQATGIQLVKDNVDYYVDPSIFKVSLEYKSDDAYLKDIKINDESIDSFDKDTLTYEYQTTEDSPKINVLPIVEDETATVKVKKQIQDPENPGSYIYQEVGIDETTNEYLIDLEAIGTDTKLQIQVTAEDEETIKIYDVIVKIPYGIVSGNITTKNIEGIYESKVKIYDNLAVDWENLESHEQLDQMQTKANFETNDDGSFEVKLFPATYDLLIDKPGYLDYIVTTITVTKDGNINLGQMDLIAGDYNKDGYVAAEDITAITQYYGVVKDDIDKYKEELDYTEDGYIAAEDIAIITQYYGSMREIKKYN